MPRTGLVPFGGTPVDLSELIVEAKGGFGYNFAVEDDRLVCPDTGENFAQDSASIVWSESVDMGTDPGDDATIFLIETTNGRKGYLLVANSFRADPRKTAFLDCIARRTAAR
jgi:hypothetical protein